MERDQLLLFAVLALTLVLFVRGRWRYDVVALLALIASVLLNLVPAAGAFSGFGHPAVVTVAAVLVVSRGLLNSGLVDILVAWTDRLGESPWLQVAASSILIALLSGFMNNVGALALLLPVAVKLAHRSGRSPSYLLMPLAFGSLLGGLVTLIGTPPNIIIASIREEAVGEPFRMFDFSPVGAGVAVAGLLFVCTIGWRLLPERKGQASAEVLFRIEDYVTEMRVSKDSEAAGKRLSELREVLESDWLVVALIRGERKIPAPSPWERLREGDILLVEADEEGLEALVDKLGLELAGSGELEKETLTSDRVSLLEGIVMPDALLVGRTARGINLRRRYGVNLMAVARQGERLKERIGRTRLQAGDVLLLQGDSQTLGERIAELGLLPLAERELRLGRPRRLLMALGMFAAAILAAALGYVPIQIGFVAVALGMILTQQISIREVYQTIEWPVIVLLGAMLPLGEALETSGGAQWMAQQVLQIGAELPDLLTLAVILVATMFLSDLVNNAAAAVLMAPIGISVAEGLEASVDPFLMAVAIGASCAFLTPIGHQSNTLVMGPGGYHFADYWRMGLPLEVVISVVSLVLIPYFWPL